MKTLTKKAKQELLTSGGILKKYYKNAISEFAISTKIHPVTYTGSGRYTTTRDMSFYIESALSLLGYKFTTGNDAKLGGKSGYYIKVSKKALESLKGLAV